MMTMREARQRAEVNNCAIERRPNGRYWRYAAKHHDWSKNTFKERAYWRDDVEDAVLDCGRINRG